MAAATAPALPDGPELSGLAATLRFKRDPTGLLDDCRRTYGERFTLALMPHGRCVVLGDPADARRVFGAAPETAQAGVANAFFGPVCGERSILVLDGDEHLRARRLMLPAFHGRALAAQGDQISRIAQAAAAGWPQDEPVALLERMQALTLDVLLAVVLGIEPGPRSRRLRSVMLDLVSWANPPGGKVARDTAAVRERADAVVLEEIARRRGDAGPAEDIVRMLLSARDEDGRALSDEEIRSNVVTLLVAGYETSATTLAWAVERLARHPEAQRRATAAACSEDDVYLDAVLRETMRVRPVFPLVARRLTAPLVLADGTELPADVTVAPSIWLINTRAATYPDPLAFRPERFVDRAPDTYAWLPFGGGIRRCLGASFAMLEMRLILRALLRRFALHATGDAERIVGRALTLTPEHHALVRLARQDPR